MSKIVYFRLLHCVSLHILDYSPEYFNFMDNNYPKGYSYQEFAKDFTAEFFDADEWAELFKKAGARYVYCNF